MKRPHAKYSAILCCLLLIPMLTATIIYIYLHLHAGVPGLEPVTVAESRSEDIILAFSAVNPSYVAGETGSFHIDVVNLHTTPLRRIDFNLKVTALTIFGLRVMEVNESSTRTFKHGVRETITINRTIPFITPSGFYLLELKGKPERLPSQPTLKLTIYIGMSNYLLGLLIFLIFTSGFRLSLIMLYDRLKTIGEAAANPILRKVAIQLLSLEDLVEDAEGQLISAIKNFSTGQRFIFSGICILISAALTLTVGLEGLAEQLAIITYFCLVLGVANLIWEYRKEVKPLKFRLPYPLRLPLSLAILTLLIYFSSSSLSPTFLMASSIVTITVALNPYIKKRRCKPRVF
ncbi:hypothetical protein KEJ23_01835 [Candidatus Bathyarchaeota archaeon]|nr:hypothetical protein [Candidatus Bathyarchaeota archaeon]